jgi:hypothetical protein
MVCSCLGSQRDILLTQIDSVSESLPIPPTLPRVTSDDYPEGNSCGNMCFREIDDTFMVTFPDPVLPHCSHGRQETGVEWGEPDIDELQCILGIIPDTIPCGLAKLVRKPCREVLRATPCVYLPYSLNTKQVYIQRRQLIPDDRVYAESTTMTTARYSTSYCSRTMILIHFRRG